MEVDPYTYQTRRQLEALSSQRAASRAEAIENLAHLRAYSAARAVAERLDDSVAEVRREAAICLGFCGGRAQLAPLVAAMEDPEWSVRQAAHAALTNLTGQELPFDALGDDGLRAAQRAAWRRWVDSVPVDGVPADVSDQLDVSDDPSEAEDFLRLERGARALAVFGGPADAHLIVALLAPYIEHDDFSPVIDGRHVGSCLTTGTYAERLYVQAAIRALGRLGGPTAESALIALLGNPQLAVYAADALGDVGTASAGEALIGAFGRYAIQPAGRMNWKRDSRYRGVVPVYHDDDRARFTSRDRVPRTAYAIAHGLVRCDLPAPDVLAERIAPMVGPMLATLPSMFDATIVYVPEPYPMMVAYLLEKAGLRQDVLDLWLATLGVDRAIPDDLPRREALAKLAGFHGPARWHSVILPALAAKASDAAAMLSLLDHKANYVRISAAKALIALDHRSSAEAIAGRLAELPDDVEHGYVGRFQTEEFNVASGRYKEAYIRALGKLGGSDAHVKLLARLCLSERNNLDIRHAAALALAEVGSEAALEALRQVDRDHEYHSVRLIAREAIHQAGLAPLRRDIPAPPQPITQRWTVPQGPEDIEAVVLLRGEHNPGNMKSIPNTLQAYTTTDAGPTTRLGRDVYRLSPVGPEGELTRLTHFQDGYVADLEVSFDGRRVIFCRRGQEDPWWHLYEMNADGTGLRQITHGAYHDVQPNYLGDGRIVFSTSRIGARDEYHGYLCTGLAVCNPDGSDIHCIGFNLGRDAEPVVDRQGRILFSRLELFYSRMKTEWNLLATQTDGTATMTLYGPERRAFWGGIQGGTSLSKPRHRVLRIAQPQPFDGVRYLINSFEGPMLVGPGRHRERMLQPDNTMAITTPYPINHKTLLVSAGKRPWRKKDGQFVLDRKGRKQRDINAAVDHGLYWMDVETGELTPIFNRPETNEFEARPLAPRYVPPVIPESPRARAGEYTATLYCQSVFNTQHEEVRRRGKYVRIAEALPSVQRHQTHRQGTVWKNHGGATGRVWATLPLAADGSFHVEVPADRMFHIQVLDSDKRVVGNELIWQYARPGETKGCFGCHDTPDRTPPARRPFPGAARVAPLSALPRGDDLRYRAKMWWKGTAPWPREERMRTVNAVDLLGRP
jgi:HEAT repeat protein